MSVEEVFKKVDEEKFVTILEGMVLSIFYLPDISGVIFKLKMDGSKIYGRSCDMYLFW